MDNQQLQRRIEMLTELRRGLDIKLQKPLRPDARKHLQKAYALATEPGLLDAPWPQIAAYRLAHVLMREGLETDWDRVDDLLCEAAQDDVLGPVPLIYRLIALSKRNPVGEPTEEMFRVYRRALATLATVDRPAALARQYVGDQRPLQSQWLNLLEAVVYMTGLDYDPIAGRVGTDPFAGLGFESSSWRVIEGADAAQVLYPEAIAHKVFESKLREAGRDVLAVKVAAGRRNSIIERHSPGKKVTRSSLRGRQAKDLLALMCRNGSHLRPDPESDANDLDSAIRQRKKRLRECLQAAVPKLETQAFDDWWEDPRPNHQPSALPPIILLVEPQS